jgi:hypothetical protein
MQPIVSYLVIIVGLRRISGRTCESASGNALLAHLCSEQLYLRSLLP